MRILISFLLVIAGVTGAEDTWKKVKDLKTGTEIRILKKGSLKPIIGTIDEANEDRVVVVVKNEQMAVSKEDVDRLDYRPPRNGGRFKKETKNTSGIDAQPPPKGAPSGTDGLSSSSSTSFSLNKPDFETVYRRGPGAPK